MRKLRFSIIIAVYNAQQFLQDALLSCVKQSFKDIEILVVDDKSSDESVKIVKKFMAEDERIKLFLNDTNLGTFATRNKGALRANGEYLLFLDADDSFDLEACKKIDESIKGFEKMTTGGGHLDIVAFNYYLKNANSKNERILYSTNALFSIKEFILHIAKNGIGTHWTLWNKAFLKSTYLKSLQNLNLHKRLLIAEDAFNFINVLLYAKNCAYISDALYLYSQNENSITQRKDEEKSIISIENHRFIINTLLSLSPLSPFKHSLVRIFCNELTICLFNEKRKLKKSFLNYLFTSFGKKIVRLKQGYYLFKFSFSKEAQ